MPLYNYKCPICDHNEEHLVKLSEVDEKLIQCPNHKLDECVLMERQVSSPSGFILVGEGFYKRSR